MRISQNCYALTGLSFVPPWSVNAGFITGESRTLIVDTGANTLSAQTIHGYASATRPGNALSVINTEQHLDHVGGNGYFRAFGLEIYGHSQLKRKEEDLHEAMVELNALIPNRVRRDAHEERVFYGGTHLANPSILLAEETRLDLGSLEVQIFFTPGHTPTNLSLYIPADGVLFCGDCIISGYLPNLESGDPAAWQRWLASLNTIERLGPRIVMPGHGNVLRDEEIGATLQHIRSVLYRAIETGHAPTLAGQEDEV
ncbi:MBL fold metallo-hydrolase [Ktedonosporobacter rubrisoli]|uniref:MBL fold metallo-hydrolase n=1 Tax=Ktedonosporobacter rubrisoli TaxID=2509675 RepID=UPI0013EEA98F|nr:MBL fold metallo-hydrolase [Ktedonosporobacter rubrisoli]